jgi:RNA polymerase sigma-70 factor, ECF subfamily
VDHQLTCQTMERPVGSTARSSDKGTIRYMVDEKTLLRQAQAMDQDALAQIHEAYYGAIYRYISFRVDDLRTVEDLTSEVFARFLAALRKRLGRPRSIRPWLYGTACRVVKEYYRSQSRWNLVALEESLSVEEMGPAQAVEEMWARRELREAIQELTEPQQMVLFLRFGGDLSIKEVAALMKKSEGAVKMLQVRAISSLARRMLERK